jgi:hypothetical protein
VGYGILVALNQFEIDTFMLQTKDGLIFVARDTIACCSGRLWKYIGSIPFGQVSRQGMYLPAGFGKQVSHVPH